MKKEWPFDQPENCAVISHREVLQSGAPVLLVTYDEEDHGWQFLTGDGAPDMAKVVLVSFKSVVATDASLFELADLPPGCQARRGSIGSPWVREKSPLQQAGA